MKKNDVIEVEIVDNGFKGEGIAKVDGFTIFIPALTASSGIPEFFNPFFIKSSGLFPPKVNWLFLSTGESTPAISSSSFDVSKGFFFGVFW